MMVFQVLRGSLIDSLGSLGSYFHVLSGSLLMVIVDGEIG